MSDVTQGLLGEWDALADQLAAAPFLRGHWITTWCGAFVPAQRPKVLSARRDGELVALLPFLEEGSVRRAPANWHTPLFAALARDDAARMELARAVLGGSSRRVDLAFLAADDPLLRDLRNAARERGRGMIVRTVLRSPYVQVDGRDWASFRSSIRKRAREAERLWRRLSEHGELSVAFETGEHGLEERLNEGFALEGSGWKSARGTAILSKAVTFRFYSELARSSAARGELLLAYLRLNGRAIAFDLCLQSAGTIYTLKGGFDPAWRQFAPGILLTYESVRRAFETGSRTLELLGADEGYKLGFTPTVRERVRFQAFSRSPAGLADQLAWSHGRRAVLSARAAWAGRTRSAG